MSTMIGGVTNAKRGVSLDTKKIPALFTNTKDASPWVWRCKESYTWQFLQSWWMHQSTLDARSMCDARKDSISSHHSCKYVWCIHRILFPQAICCLRRMCCHNQQPYSLLAVLGKKGACQKHDAFEGSLPDESGSLPPLERASRDVCSTAMCTLLAFQGGTTRSMEESMPDTKQR